MVGPNDPALVERDAPLNPERASGDETLVRCLRAALHGDYSLRPAGDDALSVTIAELLEQLSEQSMKRLDRTIGLSVETNETAISAVKIFSLLDTAKAQAKAIRASAAEVDASGASVREGAAATATRAGELRDLGQRSARSMETLQERFEDIEAAADQTAQLLSRLNGATEQIGGLVGQIDAISQQTSLLAVNASVEAARAGPSGRGFAVVAEEVRRLAGKAAEATSDVRQWIGALGSEVDAITSAVDRTGEALSDGQSAVGELQIDLGAIKGAAEGVESGAAAIASLGAEQGETAKRIDAAGGLVENIASGAVTRAQKLRRIMDRSITLIGLSIASVETVVAPGRDIRIAMADHVLWKKRLADAFAGESSLRRDELEDPRRTRFGRWYYELGAQTWGHDPRFARLERPLQATHHFGKVVTQALAAGDRPAAEAALSRLERASEALLTLLAELLAETDGAAPAAAGQGAA